MLRFFFENALFRAFYVVVILMVSASQVSGQRISPEMARFDQMSDYLTRGTGKWKASNPNFNPDNPRSAEAYGLWFERPMKNFMTLTIVSYQKDTVLISSEGFFSWHPGKEQYVHVNGNRGNGYSEGVSTFPDDSSFVSVMTIYRRNGTSYEHKDENFIVEKDKHKNISYRKDADGNWVEEGEWIWIREPEN